MTGNTAYGDAPPMFSDNVAHVFVVASSLIASGGGQECALTQGDVLQLGSNAPPSTDPNFGRPFNCH